ncbi:hypothetical protein GMA3_33 [Gordonia phage GMA3]|uniref:Uncharacterized protein n=1 Tax=Gordonia phage GMA3 TaxID=1647284 RepID=A0A0K0NKI6_9CAUD|nr:hypothetical protein AU105_gp033 [Gordonia phage GMA3]AKL88210.1 hypothetical protein GMA3_33 [Gordonia phage GMA3]
MAEFRRVITDVCGDDIVVSILDSEIYLEVKDDGGEGGIAALDPSKALSLSIVLREAQMEVDKE